MKLTLPRHKSISLILKKLVLRHLLKLSTAIVKLHKIERGLVLLAMSRKAADRSTHKLEYQFSASSTPLIHRYYYRKSVEQHGLNRFCAFLCPCISINLTSSRWDDEEIDVDLVFEPAWMLTGCEESEENVRKLTKSHAYNVEDDDCIDEKAEIFIAKFYAEIRKQRLGENSYATPIVDEA